MHVSQAWAQLSLRAILIAQLQAGLSTSLFVGLKARPWMVESEKTGLWRILEQQECLG